jgi:hypothetical protein
VDGSKLRSSRPRGRCWFRATHCAYSVGRYPVAPPRPYFSPHGIHQHAKESTTTHSNRASTYASHCKVPLKVLGDEIEPYLAPQAADDPKLRMPAFWLSYPIATCSRTRVGVSGKDCMAFRPNDRCQAQRVAQYDFTGRQHLPHALQSTYPVYCTCRSA